jgi:hypothetical protein
VRFAHPDEIGALRLWNNATRPVIAAAQRDVLLSYTDTLELRQSRT